MIPDRVVFSGLDGGLLDPQSHGWDGARPALSALARAQVPLVLCSSRPLAELTLFSRLFGLDAPLIVENGAALLVPIGHLPHGVPGASDSGRHLVLTLGPGKVRLAEELSAIAHAAGTRVHTASALTAVSSSYEYTEPFLLTDEREAAAMAREAERRGLKIVRGPRYFHLSDGADKGLAVRTLLSLYEREGLLPKAIALGAWPTDVSMLRAAHRAVLMPTPDGTLRREVAAAVPRARRAPQGGSEGWNRAVVDGLSEGTHPLRVPLPAA